VALDIARDYPALERLRQLAAGTAVAHGYGTGSAS
jgi:hypothetical protein